MQELQETWVWSLGREDPLAEGMATHSRILVWRIPWTEEPGRLQSIALNRVWLSMHALLTPRHFFFAPAVTQMPWHPQPWAGTACGWQVQEAALACPRWEVTKVAEAWHTTRLARAGTWPGDPQPTWQVPAKGSKGVGLHTCYMLLQWQQKTIFIQHLLCDKRCNSQIISRPPYNNILTTELREAKWLAQRRISQCQIMEFELRFFFF